MGRPKQLLRLDGRSFLARVAAALAPEVEEVVVLGAGPLPPDAPPLARLDDVAGLSGPLAGMLAAFRWRPEAAWIFAACDLPLLSPAAAAWLRAQRRARTLAVLPRCGDRGVEPLFALYEPAARPRLEALAHATDSSLQVLAAQPGVATPEPPDDLLPAWRNVNTAEDHAALR
jgi:molybdopterin-guanine dinucleotide biosynthesis protein A